MIDVFSFVTWLLISNVVTYSVLCTAPCSLNTLNVDKAVKIWIKGKGKYPIFCIFGDYQGKVRFNKLKSLVCVCWYLTVQSNLTALALDLRQICVWVFHVLLKAAGQAIEVFWYHGGIMQLGEGVCVSETALKPMCPIVIEVSFRLSFEEGVFLPCAL